MGGDRRPPPGAPHQPDLWLLGSSAQSAIWAAQLGLPYAFADFINPDGAAIAQDYRERFTPARLDGKVHDIDVSVRRRGLDVRARRSYLATPPSVR